MSGKNGDIASQHISELARSRFTIYRVFEVVESAALSHKRRQLAMQTARDIAEACLTSNLNVSPRAGSGIETVLKLDATVGDVAFAAWSATISHAMPNKMAVSAVLEGFSDWIGQGENVVGRLELMPQLAALCSDLTIEAMSEMLASIDKLLGIPGREHLTSFLSPYNQVNRKAAVGLVKVATLRILEGQDALLTKFADAFPPSVLRQDSDCASIVSGLSEITNKLSNSGPDLENATITLVLTISERSPGSAVGTLPDLITKLNGLPTSAKLPYLKRFGDVVETFGVQAIGYSLKELAASYRAGGRNEIQEQVKNALVTAQTYGCSAGMMFLERKPPRLGAVRPSGGLSRLRLSQLGLNRRGVLVWSGRLAPSSRAKC